LSIIKARHQAGRTSALELAQQETALANTKAAISSLEYLKKSLHNQIAILTGQAPQSFSTEKTTISDFKIPPVETIEPALLLTRRPDILSAEAALTAANFDVKVARAAFLPRFTIGIDSIIAANPASAPASIISSLASSVAAPLFQGGALQGELDRANARQSELLALYHATILRAYQDVEDSLAAVAAAQERTKSLKIAARQSNLAHSLSQMRFEEGAIDFQALLDTQRSQLQADDALAQVKLEQIAAAVSLYKALGGGWK
jgi:outer membrane protein TolC